MKVLKLILILSQLSSSLTFGQNLPDLEKVGSKCDSLRSANMFKEAACLYFDTGEQLKSSELFVYAAWQYGQAKMQDSALISINRAIDYGMSNPNILSLYSDKYAAIIELLNSDKFEYILMGSEYGFLLQNSVK